MGNEAFKSNLNLFSLSQGLLDEIRLALQEDQFTTWVNILLIIGRHLILFHHFEETRVLVFLTLLFLMVRLNLAHHIAHLDKVWANELRIFVESLK